MSCLDYYSDVMNGYDVANIFPFVINGPLWLTQVLLVVYGENISFSQRLVPGFSVCAVVMIAVPLVSDVGDSTGFGLTILVLIVLGFASGACQGTCYMMAAAFPPEYMGAIMLGNGVSGIGTNILRAATLKIFPADKGDNNLFLGALSIFLFGFLVLAACAVAQLCLTKNAFANYYLKSSSKADTDAESQ
mmetsp:Transcript_23685/g.29363  ORF Transcript_23685/g.29363 Transcript_23685/m.29363 type:complete len:190 (-) Transcript_23685:732-1301(-)|eukprot:CAMPEP_0170453616 /NCGR_PEP_ID=MMETSP0123-20130129/2141_1 /TAXON_ID=182087 /ORGANISM="Favella ehrenbergii, Strain Fehren 1" /LENGTH=189 /DNA_ID=CAMNT_0010716053 /DNA_START=162 /DNA_END=731 /DNA_ORIENTATION=+